MRGVRWRCDDLLVVVHLIPGIVKMNASSVLYRFVISSTSMFIESMGGGTN